MGIPAMSYPAGAAWSSTAYTDPTFSASASVLEAAAVAQVSLLYSQSAECYFETETLWVFLKLQDHTT